MQFSTIMLTRLEDDMLLKSIETLNANDYSMSSCILTFPLKDTFTS